MDDIAAAAPGELQDVPPQYEIIQATNPEALDQEFTYLTVSETDEPERALGDINALRFGRTKVVHVSGVRLEWDSTKPRNAAVTAFNHRSDIAEFNLYADQLIISEPMVLEGTNVRIWARRLEFQRTGCILTGAREFPDVPTKLGASGPDGAAGGTVELYVKGRDPAHPENWQQLPADQAEKYACGMFTSRESGDDSINRDASRGFVWRQEWRFDVGRGFAFEVEALPGRVEFILSRRSSQLPPRPESPGDDFIRIGLRLEKTATGLVANSAWMTGPAIGQVSTSDPHPIAVANGRVIVRLRANPALGISLGLGTDWGKDIVLQTRLPAMKARSMWFGFVKPIELAASGIKTIGPKGVRPPALPLIGANGARGQKGGPGGYERTQKHFESVERVGSDEIGQSLAEQQVHTEDNSPFEYDWVKFSVLLSIQRGRGLETGGSIGGEHVIRASIVPSWQGRKFKPIKEWHPNKEKWPPSAGEPPTAAGKPGSGGNGGDVRATLAIFTNRPNLHLADCIDFVGGVSGPQGESAYGGPADTPNPYYVDTFALNLDLVDYGRGVKWWILKDYQIQRETVAPKDCTKQKADAPAPTVPEGAPGQFELVPSNDGDWLHPFQVRAVLRYCKDLFINGQREKARALLQAYEVDLARADSKPRLRNMRDELVALEIEHQQLIHRLDHSLDFYGNPIGWAPVLSLESNLEFYNHEIDTSIEQLWLAYRIRRAFSSLADAGAALDKAKSSLESERTGLEKQLTTAQDEFPAALRALQEAVQKHNQAKAKLEPIRLRLVEQAKNNEERKRIVSGVFNVIEGATAVIPFGQPYLKAAGGALNSVGQLIADPSDPAKIVESLGTNLGDLAKDVEAYKPASIEDISSQVRRNTLDTADFEEFDKSRNLELGHDGTLFEHTQTINQKSRAVDQATAKLDRARNELDEINQKIRVEDRRRPRTSDDAKVRDQKIKGLKTDAQVAGIAIQANETALSNAKAEFESATQKLLFSGSKQDWERESGKKKADLMSKKRQLEDKLADRSDAVGKAQRALASAAQGMSKLSKGIAAFTMASEQILAAVNAELAKLKDGSPEYRELSGEVDKLALEENNTESKLKATQVRIGTATDAWLANRQKAGMVADQLALKARALDHFALQYVDKMKADARERLARYQYYIAKAYEYEFLQPCTAVDYGLSDMADRMLNLLESASGAELTVDDFGQLKTLFRAPMGAIADQIIQHCNEGVLPGRLRNIPIRLDNALLKQLNEEGRVRFNLIDAFGLPIDDVNPRVIGMTLKRAEVNDDGKRCASMKVQVRHLGKSVVRDERKLYCFDAGKPGARMYWDSILDITTNQARAGTKDRKNESILKSILGKDKVSQLLEYRPGLFSDFELSIEWNSRPSDAQPRVMKLELALDLTSQQRSDNYHMLYLRAADNLQPRLSVRTAGGDQAANFGHLFRVLDAGAQVTVEAPAAYGNYKFDRWRSSTGQTLSERSPSFRFDGARILTAHYR